jgi:hypothetical protein
VSRRAGIAGLYALLALLAVPVYSHFVSPNELSRWLLAASLVEDGTVEVSRYAPLLGPGFEDLAIARGRTYSNKAPGTTLVALPGYLLARPFAGPPGPASIRVGVFGMRLFASTLPLLLLALLVDRAARRLGADEEGRRRATFALLFATPLFAYGLLLFAHALVASALFAAFSALFLPAAGKETREEFLAGAWIGLAVAADYAAVVPAAVLVALVSRRGPGALARIAAGGLPFAILVGSYNAACFGSPFAPSYAFEKNAAYHEIAAKGFFGVTLPSVLGFFRLLLDPAKGLLLLVPALLLVPKGLAAVRRPLGAGAFTALVLVPASILLVFSGYPNFGGWTVGPRYVVGALPFLVLPLAFLPSGHLLAGLLGASAAAVVGTTVPFPFVPDGFPLPWASFAFPLLAAGGGLPLVVPAPGLLGVVLPVAAAAGAAVLAFGPARLSAFSAGAVLWWSAGFLPPSARSAEILSRVQVAYVADVYLERAGALDRLLKTFPPGLNLPERLLARRERERSLPPPDRLPAR